MVAQSFFNSASTLVPFTKFTDGVAFLKAFELIMIYFLIVTSWISYFRSTRDTKYSFGKLGVARFGTDFLILFLYFYLVILVTREAGDHGELFLYGLTIVFGIYALWDGLKYWESHAVLKEKDQSKKMDVFKTLIWFGEFMVLSFIYYHFLHYDPSLTIDQFWWVDFYFTIAAIGLIASFRFFKWRDHTVPFEKYLGKSNRKKDEVTESAFRER